LKNHVAWVTYHGQKLKTGYPERSHMMSQAYQKKGTRSRRKIQNLDGQAVKVDLADGQAKFQMVLPMPALMAEVAGAIEQMATQAGC
jgi:hypothetical protein